VNAFVDRLQSEGRRRYHDQHPFHRAMHRGELTQAQLRGWVKHRYYYQTRIPIKDALIVAKSEDPHFRRMWLHRIVDHDGVTPDDGGLTRWRGLARAVGLSEAALDDLSSVLPGVRLACDGYVEMVRNATLLEAVASSLTEAFAPDLMAQRLTALETLYPFVDPAGLEYFRQRVPRARADSEEALAYVVVHARTAQQQDACVAALVRKTEILWHILDCIAGASA
jgi:pyrroloquinoline-quinone synthase